MKKSKQMWILLIMIFVFVWIGGGCGQTGEPEGTYDINTIPDEIRAIKFDPHVNVNQGEDYYGEDQTVTIAEKVKDWKETGFNTIYLISFFRDPANGQMIYPSESVDCGYNVEKYGPDFLKELVEECKKQGMTLYAGRWMFRDNAAWETHPEWRQKMCGQLDASEGLMCPFSPYMDEVFYPYYEEMHERYGISNFFLQEMWFNWDGMGKSSSFSSYSIDAFNQLTGSSYTVENVKELENDIASDETVREQWYQMHFDKELEIINRLKDLGGGSVAWHNLREAEWETVTADPSRLEDVFINFMSLYPDVQIFNGKSTNDMDPYLCYAGTADFVSRTGNFRKVLEYYSFYGGKMKGLTRTITEEDYRYIYLAARAAGIREFVAEQDAFIERANQANPVAWDTIKYTYSVYDKVFEETSYIGEAESAEWADGQASEKSNGRFLTSWKGEDTEVVIAGVSLYKPGAEVKLPAGEGISVTDAEGNVIEDTTVSVESGEVKIFLIHRDGQQ